jgi:hypothetical protein
MSSHAEPPSGTSWFMCKLAPHKEHEKVEDSLAALPAPAAAAMSSAMPVSPEFEG